MMTKKIIFASDHGGFESKQFLIDRFKSSYEIEDLGTDGSESVDYPLFAIKMAKKIQSTAGDTSKKVETLGILICGTGIGVSMCANRFSSVRAALVYNKDSARLALEHNNANVLCLAGRQTTNQDKALMIETYLSASFEGERHLKRLKIFDHLGQK